MPAEGRAQAGVAGRQRPDPRRRQILIKGTQGAVGGLSGTPSGWGGGKWVLGVACLERGDQGCSNLFLPPGASG